MWTEGGSLAPRACSSSHLRTDGRGIDGPAPEGDGELLPGSSVPGRPSLGGALLQAGAPAGRRRSLRGPARQRQPRRRGGGAARRPPLTPTGLFPPPKVPSVHAPARPWLAANFAGDLKAEAGETSPSLTAGQREGRARALTGDLPDSPSAGAGCSPGGSPSLISERPEASRLALATTAAEAVHSPCDHAGAERSRPRKARPSPRADGCCAGG